MRSDFSYTRMLPVFAGVAAVVLFVPHAMAQETDSSTTKVEVNGSEEVTITSPRNPPTRTSFGAPIEEVSMSIPVSYSDLNLHTGEGVYTLRQRVKYAAHSVCSRLSFRYPIGAPDHMGCYSHAVENATPQANSAIWNYRSPSSM